VPIFQQYNVDIVFAGDQHIYERSVPWKKTNNPLDIGLPAGVNQGGIVYVITGGGGGPLGDVQTGVNRGAWSLNGAMVKAFHTTKITINGPVLIGEAYEEVGGTLSNPFDTFVIDRSYEAPSGLSGGSVSPSSGSAGITYRFQVKYTNGLGTAPMQATLMLDGTAYTMTLSSGTPASGAIYRYDTTLSFGNHQFYFDFGTGLRFPASGSFSGPIVNDPPTVPAAVTPADGATDVPIDVTFTWTSDDPNSNQGDVLTYDFYLGTTDLPPIPTASGLTSASYPPPVALLGGVTYYWKVVVHDSFGVTNSPATVWQFTTHAQPQPPTYTIGLPFVKR